MMGSRFKVSPGTPSRPQDLGLAPRTTTRWSWGYSNQAICLLKEGGYQVIPVHPKVRIIEDLPVTHTLRAVSGIVHTLTLYVGPERSHALIGDILRLRPRRVIQNPGTESPQLEKQLREHHIPFIHACTLVMLRTGQF